ncbi:MAG: endonuclease III [Campylobacterales bacterium]|nr:endonuclease III [Campylobacterales bacterium]
MKKQNKKNIAEIKKRFLERYGSAKTELEFTSDYELLVAIILSAQCTDKRVNIITKGLFAALPTVDAMAASSVDEIAALIKSCSYFNNKAKNLLAMAQNVVTNFGGSIPHDEVSLKSLAGVGQKTAHVFMIEFLQSNHMAVDTHVFRTAHRLGLSSAKTAAKTEEELSKAYVSELATLHQAMVLFGRYICKAKNPLCDSECFLVDFCQSRSNFKPA